MKSFKGLVIQPNGMMDEVVFTTDKQFFEAVADGESVEVIRFADGIDGWLDENGKYKRLEINVVATALCLLYNTGLHKGDDICGTFVLTGPPDEDGEVTDLPDDKIAEIRNAIETC